MDEHGGVATVRAEVAKSKRSRSVPVPVPAYLRRPVSGTGQDSAMCFRVVGPIRGVEVIASGRAIRVERLTAGSRAAQAADFASSPYTHPMQIW
jgi:hypothetical protein